MQLRLMRGPRAAVARVCSVLCRFVGGAEAVLAVPTDHVLGAGALLMFVLITTAHASACRQALNR